jgi:hypothetical protein
MSKNNYHRYIKVPFEHKFPEIFKNEPQNKRCDEIKVGKNWHEQAVHKEHWDQRIIGFLDQYGLKPANVCEAFYAGPGGGGLPIHNDTPYMSDCVNINFTWGPSSSSIRWWKVKDESNLILEHEVNLEYHKRYLKGIDVDIPQYQFFNAEEKDCDMVYEAVIDKPSLVNVGQLHSTYNPHSTDSRWTITYHLLDKKDDRHIDFDEAVELFGDLLYEKN